MPSLQGSAARKVGERARGHFVVKAGHLDGLASGQIVERQVHGAAAIMLGALLWIGDKVVIRRRSGIPENLGDIPGAIGVVDQQTVAERLEFLLRSLQSFRGWALHEGASLRVYRRAQEIVGLRVADVEMKFRIERR